MDTARRRIPSKSKSEPPAAKANKPIHGKLKSVAAKLLKATIKSKPSKPKAKIVHVNLAKIESTSNAPPDRRNSEADAARKIKNDVSKTQSKAPDAKGPLKPNNDRIPAGENYIRHRFGDRLRQERLNLGISLRKVAVEARIDASWLCKVEAGLASPRTKEIVDRLLDAYRLPPSVRTELETTWHLTRGALPADVSEEDLSKIVPRFIESLGNASKSSSK